MIVCYGARLYEGRVIAGIGEECLVRGKAVVDYLLLRTFGPGFPAGKSGTGTLFARTDVLRRFPFNPSFRRYEDHDLLIRVMLAGGGTVSVAAPVILQHPRRFAGKSERDVVYGRLLLQQYRYYLGFLYLPALLLQASDYARTDGRRTLYLATKIAALVLAPHKLLWPKIASRLMRYRR